jgi:hypothetical protein
VGQHASSPISLFPVPYAIVSSFGNLSCKPGNGNNNRIVANTLTLHQTHHHQALTGSTSYTARTRSTAPLQNNINMATASPTPIGNGLVRRTSQRQALRRLPSRPVANHNESFSAPSNQPLPNGYHPKPQQFHDDSSEDEIPVPMKLSALTKALLNDGDPAPTERPVSPPRTRRHLQPVRPADNEGPEAYSPTTQGLQDQRARHKYKVERLALLENELLD